MTRATPASWRDIDKRCGWAGNDPLYIDYHDTEWGVPKSDDLALFEKLVLEGFQAGLSWITILRKRAHFRKAFDGFDPERMARYGAKDIARLMADKGIVRNRLKIEAALDSARAYLKLTQRDSLAGFLWSFLSDGPIVNKWHSVHDLPSETELSRNLSKALKHEGFRFVGPTTTYAFMQSVGMVNDHLADCPRHAPCTRLQRTYDPPRNRPAT